MNHSGAALGPGGRSPWLWVIVAALGLSVAAGFGFFRTQARLRADAAMAERSDAIGVPNPAIAAATPPVAANDTQKMDAAKSEGAEARPAMAANSPTAAAAPPMKTIHVRAQWLFDKQPGVGVLIGAREFAEPPAKPGRETPPFELPIDPFFSGAREGLIVATTGADGRASLDVPAVWKRLRLMAQTAGAADSNMAPPLEMIEDEIEIMLFPEGRISGHVGIAETSAPAGGATVRLYAAQDRLRAETTADAEGNFSFRGLEGHLFTAFASLGNLVSEPASQQTSAVQLAARGASGVLNFSLRPGISIEGVVRRAGDGAPLAGARVLAYHPKTQMDSVLREFPPSGLGAKSAYAVVTGEDGTFRYAGLALLAWRVEANADGYAGAMASFEEVEPGNRSAQFALQESVGQPVKVLDVAGTPLADAEVITIAPQQEGIRPLGASAHTGKDGTAILDGMPRGGGIEIRVAKPGYKTTAATAAPVGAGAAPVEISVVMEADTGSALGAFAGSVRDEEGNPVAGAMVLYTRKANWNSGSYDQIRTDAEGRFWLNLGTRQQKAMGNWEASALYVRANGFALYYHGGPPGTVDSPAVVDATLTRGHWMEARFVDPEGRPLEGVRVNVQKSPAPGILEARGFMEPTTGSDGIVRAENLPATSVAISHANKEGYNSLGVTPVSVDRVNEIVLRPLLYLRGRVIDATTGAAIERFDVAINSAKAYFNSADRGLHPNGEFEIPLASSRVSNSQGAAITILAKGYDPAPVEGVEPRPRPDAQIIEIPLKPSAKSRFRLVDSLNRPVEGATVYFHPEGNWAQNWNEIAQQLSLETDVMTRVPADFAVSDGDGVITLTDPIRDGFLYIDATGFALTFVPDSQLNTMLDVAHISAATIALARGGTFSGVVTLDGAPAIGATVGVTTPDWQHTKIPIFGTTVARDGSYVFDRAAPGAYAVTARLQTGGAVRVYAENHNLGEGETKRVELSLSPGNLRLHGIVKDSAGEPLKDLIIQLTPREPSSIRVEPATTSATGAYQFLGLPTHAYTMKAAPRKTDGGSREFREIETFDMTADRQYDFVY